MNFMNTYSSGQEENSSDKIDGARLIIDCDSEGTITFECEYSEDDLGMTCASTILSCISSDTTGDLIIQSLSSAEDDEQKLANISKIKIYYDAIQKIDKQNQTSDDDVIISPIEAAVFG